MSEYNGTTMPYRTSGEDLEQFLQAIARGRGMAQIQSLFSASGTFQGTVLAAQELGYLDLETSNLSEAGRDFLLNKENRSKNVMRAIFNYEPYQMLLEYLFSRSKPSETSLDQFVNWWGVQGYGSSQNNREEGATTFAKFLAFANLGNFMIGRRGKPTRIVWENTANEIVNNLINESTENQSLINSNETTTSIDDASNPRDLNLENDLIKNNTSTNNQEGRLEENPQSQRYDETPNHVNNTPGYNTLNLTLGEGKNIQLQLPTKLTSTEKERLLQLMELMIEVVD